MKLHRFAFGVVLALGAACHRDPAPTTTGSQDHGSAATDDPWAVQKETTDPPDAEVTKGLADKACPRVVAPYFFRITKAGKTSFMLGTRHLGVGLSKMPPAVKDQLGKASLVVFETPPGDDAGGDHESLGQSLPEQLGDKAWAKYKALVGETTAGMMEHATPTVALISLMMLYEDKLSALDTEIVRSSVQRRFRRPGSRPRRSRTSSSTSCSISGC